MHLYQGDTLEALGKAFGLGGLGLAALWIVMRSKFWKNGSPRSTEVPRTEGSMASGQLTVSEWENKMRKMHDESREELMGDMRQLMESRIAEAVREALSPLPNAIAQELRRIFQEKGL